MPPEQKANGQNATRNVTSGQKAAGAKKPPGQKAAGQKAT